MARAAAFSPDAARPLASALLAQMESFIHDNPYAQGIHWFSGQEIALRLMAWVFALDTLLSRSTDAEPASLLVANALLAGATHIERHLEYAEKAVYNNHLIAEALALYLVGTFLPEAPRAQQWRLRGRAILEAQAERQFYEDGAYILQSHNYERGALLYLLWAGAVAKSGGERPASSWHAALERGLDFLVAHQNPGDGWLPNYGPNDGSLPSILATTAFPDFRPVLQAVSLATRGERLFAPGPWDEASAWLLGPDALEGPIRPPSRRSVAFRPTGYVVLRGRDSRSFSAFRCGSLRDRFSQIDMLHVDIWWRGHNVLVDPGSYLYNGPGPWHEHFMGTSSHNTVVVDGRDQMLLFRRFKALYWTKAQLLGFEDTETHAVASGEHYGYERHPGACVHRRSVLYLKDELWVVADRVLGTQRHSARLHWLGGDFPCSPDGASGRFSLRTPDGPFAVSVHGPDGQSLAGSVARGQETPPRGWLSRHFGETVPVPSLAVECQGAGPLVFLTLAGAGAPALEREGETAWRARGASTSVSFRLEDGVIADVR
jgi:asparagine synthase (glutamine-hydrolysing)